MDVRFFLVYKGIQAGRRTNYRSLLLSAEMIDFRGTAVIPNVLDNFPARRNYPVLHIGVRNMRGMLQNP